MVQRAKRLLAAGYYDNPNILAFAAARMIDDLRSGPRRARDGATPGRGARTGRESRSAASRARR